MWYYTSAERVITVTLDVFPLLCTACVSVPCSCYSRLEFWLLTPWYRSADAGLLYPTYIYTLSCGVCRGLLHPPPPSRHNTFVPDALVSLSFVNFHIQNNLYIIFQKFLISYFVNITWYFLHIVWELDNFRILLTTYWFITTNTFGWVFNIFIHYRK